MKVGESGYPLFQGKKTPEGIRMGATVFGKMKLQFKLFIGNLFNFSQIPGFVSPLDEYDRLTNMHISVKVDNLFTVFSVDGKDYYFKRLSGKYDGSGMSIICGRKE